MDTSITLGFDDFVIVNGIAGHIDNFCYDVLHIITEDSECKAIKWTEIVTFEKEYEFLSDQMGRAPLSRYIEYAREHGY